MTSTRRKIAPFQVRGIDGNKILEFGPRYSRNPQDDTTVMNVFHRTTNGGVPVLLEREDIPKLITALTEGAGRWDLPNGQTSASVEWITGDPVQALQVTCRWNGSGQSRSVRITPERVREVCAWLTDIDVNGWEGWKSGRKGSTT